MDNLRLKKQLSLVVFLPFLFVTSYSNSLENNILPLYFVTAMITEKDVEYSYTIKKIKSVKNLINNIINQIKKVFISFENKVILPASNIKITLGESRIVLNRGSPVLL